MCEDHGNEPHLAEDADIAVVEDQVDGLSRRQLLQGAGLLVGAGLVTRGAWPTRAYGAVPSLDGLSAHSMAMHVHSSFSEGGGSMDSQLYQAAINNVDVVWWTDHEWKMRARSFKRRVHFTSLTSEQTDGRPWTWSQQRSGPLSARSGGGLASQGSPGDPVASGSLQVAAESTSTSVAQVGYLAGTAPVHGLRVNAFGQRWTIDVLPESVGANAYIEMRVTLSHHPAQNGRPAGNYVLSYRVGGQGAPGSAVAQGLTGVISLPATTGTWGTHVLSLSDDVATLWPDMNPRDFSTVTLSFYAVSSGGFAQGRFDYLRIERPYTTGDIPLDIQDNIGAELAARYPTVAQRQGLEVSLGTTHINWFGGAVTIPDFVGGGGVTWIDFVRDTVEDIHAAGGLVSYNHPFGASNPTAALSQSTQDAELRRLAGVLLTNNHLGCDILEVGYPQRAGYDLAHHVGLWDVLSRNGRFVTGNGVNDDHGSNRWRGIPNNWVTRVWSVTDSEADLLAALGAGRAWATNIRAPMSLDLIADDRCPMGSVSVSSLSQRQVRVMASDLPLGATVQVVRGEVDYAGTGQPVPNTSVVASLPASEFSLGSATLAVDTMTSCFVRLTVRGSDGTVLGLSNPLWLLRDVPPGGIPLSRDYEVGSAA